MNRRYGWVMGIVVMLLLAGSATGCRQVLQTRVDRQDQQTNSGTDKKHEPDVEIVRQLGRYLELGGSACQTVSSQCRISVTTHMVDIVFD